MKTMFAVAAFAAAFAATPVLANGWSYTPQKSYHSGGLVTVSPSVSTGNVNLLNNTQVLNASPILSGNSILSGNRTNAANGNQSSIGNGILGGTLNNLLGGNRYSLRGKR